MICQFDSWGEYTRLDVHQHEPPFHIPNRCLYRQLSTHLLQKGHLFKSVVIHQPLPEVKEHYAYSNRPADAALVVCSNGEVKPLIGQWVVRGFSQRTAPAARQDGSWLPMI